MLLQFFLKTVPDLCFEHIYKLYPCQFERN